MSTQPASTHSLGHRLMVWFGQTLLMFVASSITVCALFKFVPPPGSVFMLHQQARAWLADGQWLANDYRWVDRPQISTNARLAVVASEDQLFFSHHGFDLDSIKTSLQIYENGGRLRGASTISQQTAKNLFLTPAKNFVRKALEAWFTLLMELLWDKPRILEVYLNIAEFGDHLYGIEAASQRYFGIPAKNLSRAQAALLAATLPNPLKYKADQPSAYVLKRQQWILRQMQNLGELPN